MKKTQDNLSLLIFLSIMLVMISCVPNQQASNTRKKTSSSASTTSGGTTKTDAPTASQTSSRYWYTNTAINGDVITINLNAQSVIYLRGSSIQSFLDIKDSLGNYNYNRTYCLVANYDHYTYPNAKRQLRVRAVPIVFNNFATGTKERLLRIDLPEAASNQALCQGNSVTAYSNSNTTEFATTAQSAFSPSQFCSNCTSIIPSKSILLYAPVQNGLAFEINDLVSVPTAQLNISTMGIRIDTISGSTSGDSLCTNSSCLAKGFDCCLDGQCVDDGAVRPNATLQSTYNQAISDVAAHPLNFINWPNIYYVCSLSQPGSTTPTPGPDPSTAANATFELLKHEFLCLEEGKDDAPDYSIGVCSNPIHVTRTNCLNNGSCSNASFTTQATCVSASKIWTPYTWTYHCGPTGDQTSFLTIRSSVWQRCGCEADPFPDDPSDPECPDFGLKASYDSVGNITEVLCDTPPAEGDPLPLQELSLTVPGRSAPHRFYLSQNGQAIDDVSATDFSKIIPGLTPSVEGSEFKYVDNIGKLEPEGNGSFNMNAIIGQMDVSLTQARPATRVAVEVDTTYVIMATKGYYNPCPSCARDSWFDAFMAHPPSTQGRGLEPVGHTTFRDNYLTNITLGNYEDTHFGRACFLPPTMIPYSHRAYGTTITEQRQLRLKTQAALFANGYQRDWFGFNKGALIGSFDGVRWFAIGTGRMVRATSTKLYLAINQPFADLAEPTDLVVSITTNLIGADIAAVHDFDPTLSDTNAYKNTGASCQKYHQCENDADCVTQLGWEYMCANVSAHKSVTPVFETDGIELNTEAAVTGFSKILQGGMPAGSNRRCIYRGMGAPCKYDPRADHLYTADILSTDQKVKDYSRIKNMMCAPNFYCAALNSSSFNDQVAREPNNLFNIIYGQEANVLGRPLNYTSATKQLDLTIQQSIAYNLRKYVSTGTTVPSSTEIAKWGLCRPLKSTAVSDYFTTQKDTSLRTDYISQVGGCNPNVNGYQRVQSCPVFDMDKLKTDSKLANRQYRNYIFPTVDENKALNDDHEVSGEFPLRRQQNMCGRSSRTEDGISAFTDFELPGLINNITQPSLVENACFRRAGAICHTSLECAPGPFHKTATEIRDLIYFGNSEPEKQYWEEDLICGQREPAPFLTASTFSTYELKENVCCREVGKAITMYTSSSAPSLLDSLANAGTFDTNLLTTTSPSNEGRYSRYEVVAPLTRKESAAGAQGNRFESPHFKHDMAPQADYQWRTIHETGKRTCCGGGFIRQFKDGTHDWRVRDRLKLNPEIFACLNQRNDLALISKNSSLEGSYFGNGIGGFNQSDNYENDSDFLCFTPFDGTSQEETKFGIGRGCASVPFQPTDAYTITNPQNYNDDGTSVLTLYIYPSNNYFEGGDGSGGGGSTTDIRMRGRLMPEAPYFPISFSYPTTTGAYTLWNSLGGTPTPWAYASSEDITGFAYYLPSYITKLDSTIIKEIRIRYFCNGETGCVYSLSTVDDINSVSDPGEPTHEMKSARRTITGAAIDGIPACASAPDFDVLSQVPLADIWTDLATSTADTISDICYHVDDNGRIVLGVGLTETVPPDDPNHDGFMWEWAGMEIDYIPANSRNYVYSDAPPAPQTREAVLPGNSLYYLTKLGKLDLLGIPQIHYEPLYCNSNRERIVPDLYELATDTRTDFVAAGITYTEINTGKSKPELIYSSTVVGDDHSRRADFDEAEDIRVVYKDKMTPPDIFSEHEFLCCSKLGSIVASDDECCSGFSIQDTTDPTKRICKLPRAADLNLYFNRFVSSDGLLEDIPTTETNRIGFEEKHFIPETGEIILSDEAYNIIVELGKKHCQDGNVRQGAAFGNYYGEPNRLFFSGADTFDEAPAPTDQCPECRIFGIVDSAKDFDVDGESPAGYQFFMAGYRWNHHYYCGLPQDNNN